MDYLWIYVLCPIWSLLINTLYWLFNISNWSKASSKKNGIKNRIRSTTDIKNELKKIIYEPDKYKDWRPWIITFIDRDYHDDCDGAAIFGKFLFSCIGIDSKIYSLRGGKSGHAVCVTNDKRYMVSNHLLVKITGEYKQFILNYFDNKYTRII